MKRMAHYSVPQTQDEMEKLLAISWIKTRKGTHMCAFSVFLETLLLLFKKIVFCVIIKDKVL